MKLTFVHGFGLTPQIWKYASEYLNQISFSALTLPAYSSGMGHIPESLEAYSSWLSDAIVEPTVLICHSMAGYIALESLKYKNSNILGLVLVHSHPFADSESKKILRFKTAEFIAKNNTSAFVASFIPNLFYDKKSLEIDQQAGFSNSINHLTLASNSIAMAYRSDHSVTVQNSTIPISFIVGKHDTLFDYHEILGFGLLPAVKQISLMHSSAHMTMLEEPEIFYREITLFYLYCLDLS